MEYNNAYLQSLYSDKPVESGNSFADFLLNSSVNPVSQWYSNLGGAIDVARTKESEYRNTMANEYLSATQYQRAAQDMREAGLNPALAYSNGGSSAVAASSHSFNNSTAGMSNLIGDVVRGAFSLARSALIGENLEDLTQMRIKSNEHIATQRNLNAYTIAKSRDREALNRMKYKNEFRRDQPYDFYRTFDDPLMRSIRNEYY